MILRVLIACISLLMLPAAADPVRVAAASSFRPVLIKFQPLLANRGHRMTISSAASGILVAQIISGAHFDLFFSADRERALAVERRGLTVPGSRFSYALGRLALVTRLPITSNCPPIDLLRRHRIAVANPATAPYGLAARQTLQSLGLWSELSAQLIRGTNAAQAFQFFYSGGADIALVALAQVRMLPVGSYNRCTVPQTLHEPIVQQAVILRHGVDNKAARALIRLMRSPAGKSILENAGYAVPADTQK